MAAILNSNIKHRHYENLITRIISQICFSMTMAPLHMAYICHLNGHMSIDIQYVVGGHIEFDNQNGVRPQK